MSIPYSMDSFQIINTMENRINIQQLEPEAYKAMLGLENYLATTSLTDIEKELIKIRTSQINGCAYCIEMHTKDALGYGETHQRIFALSAWWESPLFDEKENVLLKMTEEITHIQQKGLTEDTYTAAQKHFTGNEIAQIIMQIGTINLWNRIGISTHLKHEN